MEIGGVSVLSIVILVLGYIFKKQRALNQLLGNDAENQVKKSKAKKNLKENVRLQL
jgi:heme exporter protein D